MFDNYFLVITAYIYVALQTVSNIPCVRLLCSSTKSFKLKLPSFSNCKFSNFKRQRSNLKGRTFRFLRGRPHLPRAIIRGAVDLTKLASSREKKSSIKLLKKKPKIEDEDDRKQENKLPEN